MQTRMGATSLFCLVAGVVPLITTSIVAEADLRNQIANPQVATPVDSFIKGQQARQEYERQNLEQERLRLEIEAQRRELERQRRAELERQRQERARQQAIPNTYSGTTNFIILNCTFDEADDGGFSPSDEVTLKLRGNSVLIRSSDEWTPAPAGMREDAFWAIGHFVTAQEGDDPEFSEITVDRYSGLALIHTEPDQSGGIQITDFPGQCMPAVRMF